MSGAQQAKGIHNKIELEFLLKNLKNNPIIGSLF